MNRILVVTRPKYDDGTEYLSYYASLIIKEAENKQISFKDFEGKEANKENVSKFILKQNPNLLFLNGHGESDSIYGHNNEILFSSETNIDLLKKRIIYARACNAGVNLGNVAVEGNEGCFIGYNYFFSLWFDERWSAKPSNDKTAALFLEPSNEIVNCLLKGNSTETSNKKSKDRMIKNMKKILKMQEKKELGAMGWLKTLWTNYQSQVLIGNPGAVF